jgi:alkylation response protein AidB-like acyl-CoA dehydrogenase
MKDMEALAWLLEHSLILRKFSRIDCGIAHSITSTYFAPNLINLIGTEEQKKRSVLYLK